jgi:predicted nicotinamide N-methyase
VVARLCELRLHSGRSEWCWRDTEAASSSEAAASSSEAHDDDTYEFAGHCEFEPPGGGPVLRLRLLSHRQRFAARVWPAARLLSRHLHAQPSLVCGKAVLELGAGAALPSLCAALLGARTVLVTDYPDARMLENTAHNLDVNLPGPLRRRVRACGYDWSRPASRLLDELRALEASAARGAAGAPAAAPAAPAAGEEEEGPSNSAARFDVVLMSDLLYELEHEALLAAAAACLRAQPGAQVPALGSASAGEGGGRTKGGAPSAPRDRP